MKKHARIVLAAFAVLVLGLTFAACGSSNDDSNSSSSGGGSSPSGGGNLIQKVPGAASKPTITIGSKNFAEQYILGNIYAQALKAAGFKVKTSLDLGSEQIAFKALKGGQISAYPEYTGTALTSFYKIKIADISQDAQKSYEQLVGKVKADGITALPQTPFENTYVIASTKATAKKYGNPKVVSVLAKKAGSGASISGFPECRQRTDCLLLLNRAYKWHPKFVSSQGQYSDLDKGQADFTFGFSTDGPLRLDKYVTYKYDQATVPPYHVTLLTRDNVIEELGPKGEAVIAKIQKPLTEKVMAELNSRVSIDKQEPAKVATQYLQSFGFIKK